MAKNDDKNKYRDTLNLPQTDFDMRAGLVAKEPAIQAKWHEQDLYGRIRAARGGGERFVLHDGPPYANGNIHMGTALNKVLKDIVVRIRNMTGHDAPYVPGWDCHGLPIEQKVMTEAGKRVGELEASEVRRRCTEYARKFQGLQSEQFQRLGVIGQFDDPYITMAPRYEAAVLEVFACLAEYGLVTRQLKPVHWSIENRTALADAELEYADRQDPSIYVLFALAEDAGAKLGLACSERSRTDAGKINLMVWTTTPWTLPGNRAVAVHPDFTYAIARFDTADGGFVALVAAERLEAVVANLKKARGEWLTGHEMLGTVAGRKLVDAGLTYAHPLYEGQTCPVLPADHVTVEDGTGLVHTAPGHGLEDYQTGLKAGLEISCPVGEDGTFDATAPAFLQGKSVWDGNKLVIQTLTDAGTLAACLTITHSYPHDWRSKGPTIFRATEQWFISVDKSLAGGQTLRELALSATGAPADDGGVDFVPAWGRNRINGMLQSRPDWCISRQRAWGLPIPAFHAEDGGVLLTPASIRAVAAVFAEKGSDAWFALSPAELLANYDPADDPHVEDAAAFATDKLTKGRDIFDVWFESGSSWFAVAMARGLVTELPVDLYLEGSDQHRGWFQLSLLPALGARGRAPFRTVLTHGFVVDEKGYKMSKSLGNVIDVVQQLSQRGADILRLWVASQNYQEDIRCSENLIAQAEDAYRKIRNTLRFCMGSCWDFNPARHAVHPPGHTVDNWMRMELHRLIRDVRQAMDRYEFHRATRLLYEFCTVQASSVYLSAVKDRLYCELPDSPRRRATQTVIHEMLLTLIKLLAPTLVHTCDEAWDQVPNRPADEPDNVHLALLPEYDEQVLSLAEDLQEVSPDWGTISLEQLQAGPAWIWQRLLDLRADGLTRLEALRNASVKNPLDAEAVLLVRPGDDGVRQTLELYLGEMEDLLGVGYARIEESPDLPDGQWAGVEVADAREKYARCARSWKRRPDVGCDTECPDLSMRDAAVVLALKK